MRHNTPNHPIHATPTQGGARRGSTIIVAVGVLAVLALVAVSYAVVVRTDRAGAAAYERGVDLQTSARVVRDEIGALLTADLFGNKIVTPDVPFQAQVGPDSIRIWPRMFEDGEFFDVAQTAPGTFDTRDPDDQQTATIIETDPWVIALNNTPGIGAFFPSPPTRDDAWLSNSEPVNPGSPTSRRGVAHLQWTTWGQLTNLRSAYRHFRMSNSDRIGLWVRDDGRYADLGQFFVSDFADRYLRGDPGANLSFAENGSPRGVDEFTRVINGPLVGLSSTAISVTGIPFATDVFGFQIHQLDELHRGQPANTPDFVSADERFFTDTDGDLRPDARWQVLDALDGLLGLRWVVAARIVDNSALVNVNTAMEFQDPVNFQNVGDGRTPADVDLTRLMRTAHLAPDLQTQSPWTDPQEPGYTLEIYPPSAGASSYFPARIDATLLNPINQHLIEQLSLDRFMQTIEEPERAPFELLWSSDVATTPEQVFTDQDIILGPNGDDPPPQHTSRLQRYLVNRYFGVSPLQPTTERVSPYTIADEAQLRSFFGLNNGATISKIEQRFDYARLDDSSGLLSGPLRTKENINTARNLVTNTANVAEILPSTLAIASDTRRHLTTVSGVGDFSPVPVLNATMVNERPIFDRPFNTKLSFVEVPRYSPDPTDVGTVNEARFLRDRLRRDDLVRAAFDSFAWALAPLAGHRPLMSPLGTQNTGAQLASTNAADLAKFFYGGDTDITRGPAFTLQADMIAGGLPAGEAQPGAAYAILRAASLAVNLFDATDDERIDPDLPVAPGGATVDMPTVARRYNITHPEPYNIDPTATDATRFANGLALPPTLPFPPTPVTDSVVRMGVGFSWGDLRAAAGAGQVIDSRIRNSTSSETLLPIGHVGEPLNGVTLVGLDRQPFLRQVTTAAYYADRAAFFEDQSDPATFSASDQTITPNNTDEQVGVIIAWEIGNPWADPINLDSYQVAIATTVAGNALALTVNLPSTDLPPGESAVFYIVHWQNGVSAYREADAKRMMLANRDLWKADIEGRDLTAFDLDAGETGTMLLDETGAAPTAGVPFQAWGGGEAVGLILIPDARIPGAGTLVVDRLAADPAAGGSGIPGIASGDVSVIGGSVAAGQRYTGVAVATGSVYRRTNTASGFPAWVIERPTLNVDDFISADAQKSVWIVPNNQSGFGMDPPPIPGDQGAIAAASTPDLGLEDKGDFLLGGAIDLPSFQLFVPNTELRYTSEVLQLCAFTHMYVHAGPDANGATLGADIADPTRFGPGTWRTISEQLGSDGEIYRDAPVNTLVNPYLGVLDPTRFVLASNNAMNTTAVGTLGPVTATAGFGLPEALAVPLALRVVDVVEPLWTPDWRGGSRLVQGRVNINTAAQKTLRMLPLIDPQDTIGTLLPQSSSTTNDWRVPQIMTYRDRWADPIAGVGGDDPAGITGLLGFPDSALRFVDQNVEPAMFALGNATPLARGFVTPGELAILGRWDAGNPANPAASPDGVLSFLGLGADTVAITDTTVPSLDVRRGTNMGMADQDIRPTPMGGGAFNAFEGVDDVEERLAIYRAVSNIVTARSDVYTAYFKVRGYAPRDIEAVEVVASPDAAQIGGYLDELQPRFEARFLAVYDRSTVRTPVDRPKVLLFVRLPD